MAKCIGEVVIYQQLGIDLTNISKLGFINTDPLKNRFSANPSEWIRQSIIKTILTTAYSCCVLRAHLWL